MDNNSNPMGVAGFACAIGALVFCWVPVLNWILWILGLVFSAIGMGKRPKGLATAGLVISLIGIILLIILIVVMGAALTAALM